MAGRGKFFELLDFPKFAAPSVNNLDAGQTAISLIDRLFGGGFMSYASIWSRMGLIVSGHASESFIVGTFNSYKHQWKNDSIRDVVRLLKEHFGGKGTWYPLSSAPTRVLGFWFKPSIKGIWFVDGNAYAVLINPRKGQKLSSEDVRFLARGIYELYCIDDPNDPIPLIVDLSEHRKGEGRALRVHIVPATAANSLEEFDQALREFVKALEIAGVATPTDADSIISLFKKK